MIDNKAWQAGQTRLLSVKEQKRKVRLEGKTKQ